MGTYFSKNTCSLSAADVQQLLLIKVEVPPDDPELLHIKDEQEELGISHEGEPLHRLQEADVTIFPFNAGPVKCEDEEEKPLSLQLNQIQASDQRETEPPANSSVVQIKTESDGDDCGVSEPVRKLHPDSHSPSNTDASDFSETDVSSDWQEPLSDSGPKTDSDDGWKDTRAPESGAMLQNARKPL